jgi:hypothetical protein
MARFVMADDPLFMIRNRRASIRRCWAAVEKRKQGKTFKQIGLEMGVSANRAMQMVAVAMRALERQQAAESNRPPHQRAHLARVFDPDEFFVRGVWKGIELR